MPTTVPNGVGIGGREIALPRKKLFGDFGRIYALKDAHLGAGHAPEEGVARARAGAGKRRRSRGRHEDTGSCFYPRREAARRLLRPQDRDARSGRRRVGEKKKKSSFSNGKSKSSHKWTGFGILNPNSGFQDLYHNILLNTHIHTHTRPRPPAQENHRGPPSPEPATPLQLR